VGSRGARHRCRCTLARGFRHRDPASGAPSPAELGPRTRRDTKARGLDPGSVEPGPDAVRRLLQPTQPASTTAGSPDPRLVCERTKLRALARSARPALRRRLSHERAETPSLLRRRGARSSGSAEASPTNRIPAPSTGSTVDALTFDPRPKPRSTGKGN